MQKISIKYRGDAQGPFVLHAPNGVQCCGRHVTSFMSSRCNLDNYRCSKWPQLGGKPHTVLRRCVAHDEAIYRAPLRQRLRVRVGRVQKPFGMDDLNALARVFRSRVARSTRRPVSTQPSRNQRRPACRCGFPCLELSIGCENLYMVPHVLIIANHIENRRISNRPLS